MKNNKIEHMGRYLEFELATKKENDESKGDNR